jgi:hypothetical protein
MGPSQEGRSGAYSVWQPFGIHRIQDMTSVHFDDLDVVAPPDIEPIGFQTPAP